MDEILKCDHSNKSYLLCHTRVVQFFVNCHPSNEVIGHNVPVVLFVFMYFFFTKFKWYSVVHNLT